MEQDLTKRFILLECYKPWKTIDKSQYTASYEDVETSTFLTKIRLDMIARVDAPDTFIATPCAATLTYFEPENEEHREVTYQRVVVLCSTSKGINGFQDSLYITERCIKPLQDAMDEVFGSTVYGLAQGKLND